jgi:hypothetical protein
MDRGDLRSRLLIAGLAAVALALPGAATLLPGAALAQSATGTTGATGTSGVPAGLITGRVTNSAGQPLAGINVTAAPAGNDAVLTQGTTDASGNYALVVTPGSYDVAFNAFDTDSNYAPVVYGGTGPSASATCIVCGGAPQVVSNGASTAGIDAVLAPPAQTGTIRPLSGNTIKVVDDRVSFKFGCHEDGIGCEGSGVLRIGTSTSAPVVSTEHFEVAPDHTVTLHFAVPSSVLRSLKNAKHNALAAIVQLTTTPSSTTTRFTLVDRPSTA